MKWYIFFAIIFGGLVSTNLAAAADSLPLTKVSETPTTITLGWTPPPSAVAYTFWVDGNRVSNTQDGSRSTVKFSRAACHGQTDCYQVKAQSLLAVGGSTGENQPPPPQPQCSDGIDNDNDGKIDYPADPGCVNATDNDETDAPPPPPTTMTVAQFREKLATNGAIIDNVTVNADSSADVTGSNVTVRNSTIIGDFGLNIRGNGFTMTDSTLRGNFNIFGADNTTLEGNTFDGLGRESSNQIWDDPARNAPDGFVIRNNTITGYHGANCDVHGEGLFIGGYASNGLVEGNHFEQNGCTSHIFFSWWGQSTYQGGSQTAASPQHICVRNNTFGPRFSITYFDINFRSEIPSSADIKVDPDQHASTTNPEFNRDC